MSTDANHQTVSLFKRVNHELGNNGGDIPSTLAGFREEFNAQNGDGQLGEGLQSLATMRILDLEALLGHARRITELFDQWEARQD